MTPRLDWSHYRAKPLPHLQVGEIVVPDDHPAGCARWRVVETDGANALLEATEACTPSRIKRHARSLTIVGVKP